MKKADCWREDWRIAGQEGYLKGKTLQHRVFRRNICADDFWQCEFCWDAFSLDEDQSEPQRAYFEPNGRKWVCEKCFADFQPFFSWDIEEISEIHAEPQTEQPESEYQGIYYNEQTGEIWHPHLSCGEPVGPHWDYNYKGSGTPGWRVYKDNHKEPR